MTATLTPPYVPQAPPGLPEVRVQPPVVFVEPVWEYRLEPVEGVPNEPMMNALGADGWELVGVIPVAGGVQLYFKRLVR
jgi:hypothetical protein